MSTPHGGPTPPRAAEALLTRLLGAGDREAVVEELRELFALRCARRGPDEARRWYVRQVAAFAWQLARHGRSRRGSGRSRVESAMRRRERRGGVDMSKWTDDLAHAGRRLRRAPVFTGVATLTIGIGIGAFASIFSLVDAVLLESMPYENPDELAWVWRDYVNADFPRGWLGGPDVAGMMQQPDVFEHAVAFRSGALNLAGTDGASPTQLMAHYASPGLFELLGVPLLLGREPGAEEYEPEGPEVAVLSYELWRTHFGSDRSIVGRSITLNGQPTEVVGVAPERFRFVKHGSLSGPVAADLYMPLRADLASDDPFGGSYAALVRVRPEVHPDQVEAALATAAQRVNEAYAGERIQVRLWTVDLQTDLVEPVRPALVALVGSAAFLLLILAANLATLLLGRAATREREVGIRMALGAGRSRILSSVVAESTLLAISGGTLGIALAMAGTDLVVRLAPDDLPRLAAVGVDASVLAVAVAVTAAMAFVGGLTPAFYSARSSVVEAMREGSARTGGSVRGARARGALVAAQVALSLMLLVGAGVTTRAFAALLRQDPGFDVTTALTFRVPLPGALYAGPERMAFHDELRTRLAALPGVTAVGASTVLPLTLLTNQREIAFLDAPLEPNKGILTDNFRVTPGYFGASGHRLIDGRDFAELDADTTTLSIIIDDVLARRFFPDGSAVGARALFVGDTATVVGVVDQARLYNVHADDRGQVYLPVQRFPTTSLSYAVRTSLDPGDLTPAVRAILREMDPSVPMSSVRTLEQIVADSLGEQRLSLTLLVGFALGALLLASIGIYGVVSNTVVRRTQEIGVRMALGAGRERVVRLVIGQGLRLALVGAAIGLLGAASAARLVEGIMVGIDTSSPIVYAIVALGLVGVAALASYLPALRATRIDPLEALRPQ